MEGKCSKRVWSGGSFDGHLCRNLACVEEAGRLWCRTHAPSAVQAREEASAARRKADAEERQRVRDMNLRAERLRERSLEAIKLIAAGHNDPQGLARYVLTETPEPQP